MSDEAEDDEEAEVEALFDLGDGDATRCFLAAGRFDFLLLDALDDEDDEDDDDEEEEELLLDEEEDEDESLSEELLLEDESLLLLLLDDDEEDEEEDGAFRFFEPIEDGAGVMGGGAIDRAGLGALAGFLALTSLSPSSSDDDESESDDESEDEDEDDASVARSAWTAASLSNGRTSFSTSSSLLSSDELLDDDDELLLLESTSTTPACDDFLADLFRRKWGPVQTVEEINTSHGAGPDDARADKW